MSDNNHNEAYHKLNLMAILRHSFVNGPGDRFTIWTQGCNKGCQGCFNPESWHNKVNQLVDPKELATQIIQENSDGLTLTGGDPLEQPRAIKTLLETLHDAQGHLIGLPKGIIVFTGFTFEEIQNMDSPDGQAIRDCLPLIDLLIDGRFVESLKIDDKLAGSANQKFYYNPAVGRGRIRIGDDEVLIDQAIEIHMTNPSVAEVTGFPPMDKNSRKRLKQLGLIVKQ